MPRILFPFRYGSVPAVVPEEPPPAPRWTNVTGSSARWNSSAQAIRRFEHVYADTPSSSFGRSVNFNYRVSSEYPFLISTVQGTAIIASTITNP